MSNAAPTHEQILALCKLVRDGGTLTVEQRHHLAELLDIVGSAVRVASQALEIYPDAPERRDRVVAGVMDHIGPAYAELVAAVTTARSGGQGHAA